MINLNNVLKQLDYSLYTYEERLALVNQIFGISHNDTISYDDDWLEIIENIKSVYNQNDELYENTSFARCLEIIGTYLLNTPEVKDKEKGKLYHSEGLDVLIKKDNDFKQEVSELVEEDKSFLQEIRKVKKTYGKIDTKKKLTSKDIQNSKYLKSLAEILTKYQKQLKQLKDSKSTYKEKYSYISKIKKFIFYLKNDMLLVYESENRPIKFKSPLKGFSSPDWDRLDMSDVSVLKCLLQMENTYFPSDDLYNILLDLDVLIKKTDLTEKQKEMLEYYRVGYPNVEIARLMNISPVMVSKFIGSICNRLSKTYFQLLEDWYYLNCSKGEYKTCKKCKSVKLVNKFYKRKGNIDNICKECCKK